MEVLAACGFMLWFRSRPWSGDSALDLAIEHEAHLCPHIYVPHTVSSKTFLFYHRAKEKSPSQAHSIPRDTWNEQGGRLIFGPSGVLVGWH